MLNILLLNAFLISFVFSWELVQVLMFSIYLILVLQCGHYLNLFELGYGLSIYYLSYILILLSAWLLSFNTEFFLENNLNYLGILGPIPTW